MDLSFLVIQALNGLSDASFLFITASGLTIVYGVTRILNFAHGSFYMLGAYFTATLVPWLLDISYGPASFWLGILLASTAVAICGLAMEFLLLRRIYAAPELFQLLATFGVVLIVEDLVKWGFGAADVLGPRAPGLRGAVAILGHRFPTYDLVIIAAGPAIFFALWLLLKWTRFGLLIRAAAQDRQMVASLGVNQALLFAGTLALGSFLAGLAGALQIPKSPANGGMDMAIIVEAFVVTVVGGMGSLPGAFIAALMIGELQAFGILIFPKITLVLIFILMAGILVVRPWGLLGRTESTEAISADVTGSAPWRPIHWLAALAGLALLACLTLVVPGYMIKLATEILIFGLFATSLNLLLRTGGIVSFSHAAYFGFGAYVPALLLAKTHVPMEAGLLLAPLAAGALAAVFGFFIARLTGIYLAMLTLAAAQIMYAIAFQWDWLTGGENGLVGIWPSAWATPTSVYYLLTLAICGSLMLALAYLNETPFGYALRAARDSPIRAESIGISVFKQRWLAFIVAGACAGVAGALYAFSRGSVDPSVLSIQASVDALLMVMFGGIQSVLGPLIGAATLYALKDELMRAAEMWRLALGLTIIIVVIASPGGLIGLFRSCLRMARGRTALK
jgi:branched-chain amino acid transport system permease protein